MEKINFKKEQIPFTQVANVVLNDPRLSARAKGLYAYLYSKPDGWDFNTIRIARDFKDGRDAIRSGIKELETVGYLKRFKTAVGRMDYLLASHPVTDSQSQAMTEKPSDGKAVRRESSPLSNKEEKEIKNSSNKESSQKFSDQDLLMVDLLISLIVRNNPDWQMRGTRETWAEHIEKLHRIDGRTYQQIEYMIKWTQNDSFWQQNILSTQKLREKFNDLIPKLKASLGRQIAKEQQDSKPKMII